MIKVLIADDHPLIRQGLKQVLAETSDLVVADEAASSQEVLDKVRSQRFDVLVLDISMPGKSGLDIMEELKRQNPRLHILILSRYTEEMYAHRALKAGASGYITKSSIAKELVDAIRKVAAGRKYISTDLAEQMASYLVAGTVKKQLQHEKLSPQEFKILRMIASGKTISDIARELSLSPSTISTHRSRIMGKMALGSDAELIRYALEHELID